MTTLLAAPMIDMPGWASALIALIVITLIMTFAVMFAPYYERKIVARMQQRLGPTRTGPMGLLQPIADTFKLLTKEDLRPASADPIAFELAVFGIFVPAFLALVAVPFTADWIVSPLPTGARHDTLVGPRCSRTPAPTMFGAVAE